MSHTKSVDALATVGTILPGPEERDAIHIAVLAVKSMGWMEPGQTVKLSSAGLAVECDKDDPHCVGIVDPYLQNHVERGQWFWLFLKPRTITTLRHVWEHPLVPSSLSVAPVTNSDELTPEQEHKGRLLLGDPQAKAVERIKDIANELDVTTEWLLEEADIAVRSRDGHYVYHPDDSGRFEGESLPDDFWPMYELVRDVKLKKQPEIYFSCSC